MKREEVLVNCIDDIESGKRSLEECLAAHPEFASELEGIVRVMSDIDAETVVPRPEFKQLTRAKLIREIAATRVEHRESGPRRRWFPSWRLAYAPVAALVLVLIGSGSAAFASQDSLPGDVLYPVKTGFVERFQKALTFSPESRANLHIELAERRVDEVALESSQGREIQTAGLTTLGDEIDDVFKNVMEVPADVAGGLLDRLSHSTASQQATLEQVSAAANDAERPVVEQAIMAARRGNTIARIASLNPSLLATGVSVTDDNLDHSYFEIEGNVVYVMGQTWNVGGIQINNVNSGNQMPPVGDPIKVYGLVRDDNTYIGKFESGPASDNRSIIRGVFTGEDDEGHWSIGGISVAPSANATPPVLGHEVEVKGTLRGGVFDFDDDDYHGESDYGDEEDEEESQTVTPDSYSGDGGTRGESDEGSEEDEENQAVAPDSYTTSTQYSPSPTSSTPLTTSTLPPVIENTTPYEGDADDDSGADNPQYNPGDHDDGGGSSHDGDSGDEEESHEHDD